MGLYHKSKELTNKHQISLSLKPISHYATGITQWPAFASSSIFGHIAWLTSLLPFFLEHLTFKIYIQSVDKFSYCFLPNHLLRSIFYSQNISLKKKKKRVLRGTVDSSYFKRNIYIYTHTHTYIYTHIHTHITTTNNHCLHNVRVCSDCEVMTPLWAPFSESVESVNCSVVSDSLWTHGLSMEFSRQEY